MLVAGVNNPHETISNPAVYIALRVLYQAIEEANGRGFRDENRALWGRIQADARRFLSTDNPRLRELFSIIDGAVVFNPVTEESVQFRVSYEQFIADNRKKFRVKGAHYAQTYKVSRQ